LSVKIKEKIKKPSIIRIIHVHQNANFTSRKIYFCHLKKIIHTFTLTIIDYTPKSKLLFFKNLIILTEAVINQRKFSLC
jgi:hypothetical protein